MADLDLATILADGEYLKRAGDTLVGDIPAGGGGGGGSTILDGTGPPDVALGAVGNYYEDRLAGVLYGPKSASGWGAEQRPTITTPTPASNVNAEMGMVWRFARAGRITKVRYQRLNTSTGTLAFRIWNMAGTKLAEVSDTQSTTAAFEIAFPTPVVVSGGETMVVSGGAAAFPVRAGGTPAASSSVDVSYVERRVNGTPGVFPSTDGSNVGFVEPIFEPNEAWPVTVRTIDGYQATNVALTDLTSKWAPASTAGPATLQLFEDTDNGTNKITLTAPATLGGDFTATLPGANGTVCLLTAPQTLTSKVIVDTIVTYSATATTAVLGDAGCYVRFTGTNPTYTVPPNSAVAFPVGTQIDGIGAATAMTLIQGAGVTLTKARTLVTLGAGSGWTLIKTATDAWDLHGDFV